MVVSVKALIILLHNVCAWPNSAQSVLHFSAFIYSIYVVKWYALTLHVCTCMHVQFFYTN